MDVILLLAVIHDNCVIQGCTLTCIQSLHLAVIHDLCVIHIHGVLQCVNFTVFQSVDLTIIHVIQAIRFPNDRFIHVITHSFKDWTGYIVVGTVLRVRFTVIGCILVFTRLIPTTVSHFRSIVSLAIRSRSVAFLFVSRFFGLFATPANIIVIAVKVDNAVNLGQGVLGGGHMISRGLYYIISRDLCPLISRDLFSLISRGLYYYIMISRGLYSYIIIRGLYYYIRRDLHSKISRKLYSMISRGL